MTTIDFLTGLANWLLADPSHIVTAAAAVASVTPTPDPATPAGKLYRVLEIFALNVLRAKETGQTAPAAAPAAPMPASPHPDPLAPQGGAVMRSLALVLALIGTGLALSACAHKPATTDVFELRAGYDASVLAPMAAYARLPACPAAGQPGAQVAAASAAPVCSRPDVLAKLRQADGAAKAALDAAEATVRQHPTLDASAAVAGAENAVAAVRSILATYNIH